jgi:hypothetical protein
MPYLVTLATVVALWFVPVALNAAEDQPLAGVHRIVLQPYEGYDEVLERYSAWLLGQKSTGWDIVDVHGPMKQFLSEARRRDPSYRLADDGVHINATGHWLIAREILPHWGVRDRLVVEAVNGEKVMAGKPHGLAILKLVQKKQRILKDAWLTTTGHKRPGMNQGLPLKDAQQQAHELDAEIDALVGRKTETPVKSSQGPASTSIDRPSTRVTLPNSIFPANALGSGTGAAVNVALPPPVLD